MRQPTVPIDRLNAEARLMLEADRLWPQDVGALAILDGAPLFDETGQFRIERVMERIGARLHLVRRLRQVIHEPGRGLGGPVWLDAPGFDLHDHVQVVHLPSPAGEAELLHTVERLRRRRLERSRPLWEIWCLPGLAERRVGLFFRYHHAVADGRAAMTMLAAFLDMTPSATVGLPPAWTPVALPARRVLLADALVHRLRQVVGVPSKLARPRHLLHNLRVSLSSTRELIGEKPVPKTSLDRLVGPDRTTALIRADLRVVKEIGSRHHATASDVLLALTAGGLRALLLSRGEPVDGLTLRIYVPVSLRRRLRGTAEGNLISQMVVHLPLSESDPGRRLAEIGAETAKRKHRARPSMGSLLLVGMVRRRLLKIIARQRVNSTGTLLHGPSRPFYLAGARILEIFPVMNLFGNETLGVGGLSYAGALNIGVVGDKDTYPDIEVFAQGVREELHALKAEAQAAPLPTSAARDGSRAATRGAPVPRPPRGPSANERVGLPSGS